MSKATTKNEKEKRKNEKEEAKEVKDKAEVAKENAESEGFWSGFKKKFSGIFGKGEDSKAKK